uniref:Uncharacterized protein n=1 Tax=Arundo donax TaxID=35708 RepID=A0A0A9B9Q9_ARUDO
MWPHCYTPILHPANHLSTKKLIFHFITLIRVSNFCSFMDKSYCTATYKFEINFNNVLPTLKHTTHLGH